MRVCDRDGALATKIIWYDLISEGIKRPREFDLCQSCFEKIDAFITDPKAKEVQPDAKKKRPGRRAKRTKKA